MDIKTLIIFTENPICRNIAQKATPIHSPMNMKQNITYVNSANAVPVGLSPITNVSKIDKLPAESSRNGNAIRK